MMRPAFILTLLMPLSAQADLFSFTADLGVGYRIDSLEIDKKIDYELFPVSEVTKWKDLGIWECVARAEVDGPCDLFVYLLGKYGWVSTGRFELEDRYQDYPDQLYLEASSNDVDGNAYDLRGALGYRFYSCCNSLMIAPLVGYSYIHNHYKASRGTWQPATQDFSSLIPFTGNLSNRYSGVWIGFEATYDLLSCLQLYGSIQYDWMHYRASGQEQFGVVLTDGSIFTSKRVLCDRATTQGPLIQVGMDAPLGCNFYIGTLFEWRYLHATKAHENLDDRILLFSEDDAPEEVIEQLHLPINHIKWNSWSIQLHVGYSF